MLFTKLTLCSQIRNIVLTVAMNLVFIYLGEECLVITYSASCATLCLVDVISGPADDKTAKKTQVTVLVDYSIFFFCISFDHLCLFSYEITFRITASLNSYMIHLRHGIRFFLIHFIIFMIMNTLEIVCLIPM